MTEDAQNIPPKDDASQLSEAAPKVEGLDKLAGQQDAVLADDKDHKDENSGIKDGEASQSAADVKETKESVQSSTNPRIKNNDLKDATKPEEDSIGDTVQGNQIKAEAVKAGTYVNIGQYIATKETTEEGKRDEDRRFNFQKVPSTLREKIGSVFVPPPGYNQFVNNILQKGTFDEERITIVHGPEHAGKFTCAVKLVSDLFGDEKPIQLYVWTERDRISLLHLVNYAEIEENTVIIWQDLADNDPGLLDFSTAYLSVLNRWLHDNNLHLILTMEELPHLSSLPLPKLNAVLANDDFQLVLEKHLDRYEAGQEQVFIVGDLIKVVQAHQTEIISHFNHPAQIDNFCHELSRLSRDADFDELVNLAKQLGMADQFSARLWFQNLEPNNARLYAMMVLLFPGVNRFDLDALYTQAVKILRQDGVSNLIDSREIGSNDLLLMIKAKETEEGRVRFDSTLVKQEVSRQLRNHNHLLWTLVEYFLELIDEYKAPKHWQIRRDLGAAIGRIGVYHPIKLLHTLDLLAKHKSGGVVAAAGYALVEICRSEPQQASLIIELLRKWVQSGDKDYLWAVGVCFWRVYDDFVESDVEKQELLDFKSILTKLGEDFDDFNNGTKLLALKNALGDEIGSKEEVRLDRNIDQKIAARMQQYLLNYAFDNIEAIIHAIRQISQTRMQDAVDYVATWLEAEPSSHLAELGQTIALRLFKENKDPKLLFFDKHIALLNLIHPILALEESEKDNQYLTILFQELFDTVEKWLAYSNEWQESIQKTLLAIINRANARVLNRLQKGIDTWLENSSLQVQRIGQQLLNRAHLMEGVPVTMPGQLHGAIIMDSSKLGRRNNIAARLGRWAYSRFEAQAEMYLMQMGNQKVLVPPGQSVSSSFIQAGHNQPRLMYPALQELQTKQISFDYIVLMTWGEVVDWSDLEDENTIASLVIVSAINGSANSPITDPDVSFDPVEILDPQIFDDTKQELESNINRRISQTVFTLEPALWLDMLQDHLENIDDLDLLAGELKTKICALDTLVSNQNDIDDVQIVVSAILMMATINIDKCISLLKTWVEQEAEDLLVRIGVLGSTVLFRLYSEGAKNLPVEKYTNILTLIPLIENTDYCWDVLEVLLNASMKWAKDPRWVERLTMQPDGTTGELLRFLDTLSTKQPNLVKAKLDQLETQVSQQERSTSDSIKKLIERLQLRVALNYLWEMPLLEDGHQYGLIVVDAGEPNLDKRKHLVNIAVQAIKEINDHDKNQFETIHLITYRLGQNQPLAGQWDNPSENTFLTPGLILSPPLLGSLLDNYQTDQVAFILLLTERQAWDEADWHGSNWNEKILVYNLSGNPGWAEKFSHISGQLEDKDNKRGAKRIVSKLTDLIGDLPE